MRAVALAGAAMLLLAPPAILDSRVPRSATGLAAKSQPTLDSDVDVFNGAGVSAGPVYTVPQVFDDPLVRHLQATAQARSASGKTSTFLTQPVHLERTPAAVQTGVV